MDLMGPVEKESATGKNRYILVIVDDHTRFAWTYFLRHKSDACSTIKDFVAYVERNFEAKVKAFRSDRGGEFVNEELGGWMRAIGIKHELTIPHTPQQNGVAERYNRTLIERARSMLLASGLPTRFWEYSVRYATWLTNRLPTSALPGDGIPYTILEGKPPSLAMAKVFGSLAHVLVDMGKRKKKKLKFSPRSQWGVFLGISPESKGWLFYLPLSGEIGYLSRDAFFHESLGYHDYQARHLGPPPKGGVVKDPALEFRDPFPGEGWDVHLPPFESHALPPPATVPAEAPKEKISDIHPTDGMEEPHTPCISLHGDDTVSSLASPKGEDAAGLFREGPSSPEEDDPMMGETISHHSSEGRSEKSHPLTAEVVRSHQSAKKIPHVPFSKTLSYKIASSSYCPHPSIWWKELWGKESAISIPNGTSPQL